MHSFLKKLHSSPISKITLKFRGMSYFNIKILVSFYPLYTALSTMKMPNSNSQSSIGKKEMNWK